MRWRKRGWIVPALLSIRRLLVVGLLACGILGCMPLGCMSSTQQAAIRYRAQHQGTVDRLPDTTVEQLQGCTESHSEQLGQADPPFAHAKAHVQVTPEGHVVDVDVTGIPADLAACTRMSLRAMALPGSVLSLRQKETEESATRQTIPKGNEIANPVVLVEVAILLGEFIAQHGGRMVLYTVTLEVVSAAAVAGTAVYLKKRKKKTCTEHLQDCLNTPLNDENGNNWNTMRCKTCFDVCRLSDRWPSEISLGSCNY